MISRSGKGSQTGAGGSSGGVTMLGGRKGKGRSAAVPAGRGERATGAAGYTARTAAGGADLRLGGGSLSAGQARTSRPKAAAQERDTAYSTRYFLWAFLISGWLFTVGASITRGQMPELFVAVILTGIILQGLIPYIAARAARLELSRELSSVEALAGGELKVKLALRSRIPLPLLWISLRETLVNECGAEARTVQFRHIALPWGSKVWRIHYTVRGLERGEYHLRPTEAVFGDMLGLTAVRRKVSASERSVNGGAASANVSFLVLPAWHGAVAAPGYGGRITSMHESRQMVPSSGGYGNPANGGRQTRAAAQRTTADRGGTQRMPYRPGDDARRIDWRAAARGGIWMTKREWAVRPPELLVILDTMTASYNGDDRLFDCAAGYAAELVRHAATDRVPFRLIGIESAQTGGLTGAGLRRSIEREALEKLALVRPATAASSGEIAALTGAEKDIPRGATLIVVTAQWRSGALGERLAALAAASGCRAEVHVLTPSKVPSLAMRERKRDWESAGIRVVWAVMEDDDAMPAGSAVAEGGDADDSANG